MKRFAALLCILCTACSSGGPVNSICAFYDVPIGASQEELMCQAGEPISVRTCSDGSIEYEYIERFKVGGRILNERHYYVLVRDGVVVSKRVKQVSPTPFGYDSYEMQTTQKEDPIVE